MARIARVHAGLSARIWCAQSDHCSAVAGGDGVSGGPRLAGGRGMGLRVGRLRRDERRVLGAVDAPMARRTASTSCCRWRYGGCPLSARSQRRITVSRCRRRERARPRESAAYAESRSSLVVVSASSRSRCWIDCAEQTGRVAPLKSCTRAYRDVDVRCRMVEASVREGRERDWDTYV